MKTFVRFLFFSFPYLRKYWWRFSVGVVLGFLYGFSNGFTLGSVAILLQRLTDPEKVLKIIQAGVVEQQGAKINDKGVLKKHTWDTFGGRIEQTFYIAINPWLPLKGRQVDWMQCVGLFALFPVCAAVRGSLGYGSTYLMAWAGQRITNDVKLAAFEKLCAQSPDYFNKTPTPMLLMHLENDTSGLKTFLNLGLTDLFQQPCAVFSLFVAMYIIDSNLTLLALIFVPLFIIPTRFIGKKIKNVGRIDKEMMVLQSSIALETFNNIRITKAYCLEEPHAAAYGKSGNKTARYAMKMLQNKEMLGPILETLSMVGVSAIFLFVVVTGRSVDTLGTFILAMIMFFAPIKRLSTLGVYFVQLNMVADRLMDLFAMESDINDPKDPIPLLGFNEHVRFNEVSLSYSRNPDPVLNRVSFDIPRGRRLGLAGESGAGKSSMLLLMLRFWDPSSGSIEIDGLDIRKFTMKDLRAQIAYVTQEVQLFNETIAENIRFGRLNATREEIIQAAKDAHADDFIRGLPQGYDTQVGERGVMLSGGQRQRVAIARAFVRNAPILILDEATASLDSQSEAEVQRAIDELAENRTVICVAHRLSTLRKMDEIIVLKRGGDIAERGSFQELLKKGGLFTKMAGAQSIFASDEGSKDKLAA